MMPVINAKKWAGCMTCTPLTRPRKLKLHVSFVRVYSVFCFFFCLRSLCFFLLRCCRLCLVAFQTNRLPIARVKCLLELVVSQQPKPHIDCCSPLCIAMSFRQSSAFIMASFSTIRKCCQKHHHNQREHIIRSPQQTQFKSIFYFNRNWFFVLLLLVWNEPIWSTVYVVIMWLSRFFFYFIINPLPWPNQSNSSIEQKMEFMFVRRYCCLLLAW